VFILDTNILSAMMRLQLETEVATWIAAQPAELLFTTSLSQAEILAGLAIMPDGRRRRDLEAAVRVMFLEDFDGRVLPFDMKAAAAYADIFASWRRAGRPATTIDLMIASVARSHGASVVTRDTGGFEGCGVALVNPWEIHGKFHEEGAGWG
jgi:predicted nucleic acid-binding protein